VTKPHRKTPPAPSPASTVAAIALKGLIEALPGGSVLHDLLQARQKEIAEAVAAERQRRLDTFWAEMLSAPATMDEQQARALLDSADFHSLLRACLTDIEDEKLREYANMACSLATGTIGTGSRRHFILCLRDLSAEELALLKGAYVARHEPNMMSGAGSGSIDEGEYLSAGTPGSFRAVQIAALTAKGFVHDSKLTSLGIAFVRAAWRESDLTPNALGRETWSGYHVAILNYEIGQGTLDRIADQLTIGLHQQRCKSSILAVTQQNMQRVLMMTGASTRLAILLVGGHTAQLSSHSEVLKEYVSRVPTVAVLTDPTVDLPDSIAVPQLLQLGAVGPENLVPEVMDRLARAYAAKHGDA